MIFALLVPWGVALFGVGLGLASVLASNSLFVRIPFKWRRFVVDLDRCTSFLPLLLLNLVSVCSSNAFMFAFCFCYT